MNKRVKLLWVRALKSGKYKQAKMCLIRGDKNDRSYCCLGVLTKLYCDEKHKSFAKVTVGSEGTLPIEVAKWAGIKFIKGEPSVDPIVISNVSASDANDNRGWDFARIGDAISRNKNL